MILVTLLLFGCAPTQAELCDGGELSNFCEVEPSGHYQVPPCPTLSEVVEQYCEGDVTRNCGEQAVSARGLCTNVRLDYPGAEISQTWTFNTKGRLVMFQVVQPFDKACHDFPLSYGDDSSCM